MQSEKRKVKSAKWKRKAKARFNAPRLNMTHIFLNSSNYRWEISDYSIRYWKLWLIPELVDMRL